jgi:tetratricopeptide (TPR) repeat protein
MQLSFVPRTCLVLAVAALLLAPAVGCGTKKKTKKGRTIAQQLDDARKEKTPDAQARKLIRVARTQFKANDKTGAAKTLAEATGLIPADGEAVVCGPRLVEIADLYADMEDRKPAREVLKKAVDRAPDIGDAISRIRLLADAGGIYGAKSGGLGDGKAAREVLASAVEAAGTVEDRFKAQALAAIALGYARADLAKEAGRVVEELEASAKAVEELRPKAEALAAAARVRARTGAQDEAGKLLAEASDAAKKIADKGMAAENRTYALLSIASAYLATGDAKAAATLLKLAEKSAGQVPDPEGQKNATEKVRALQAEAERKL